MIHDYHIQIDVGSQIKLDPSDVKKTIKKFLKKKFDGICIDIQVNRRDVDEGD